MTTLRQAAQQALNEFADARDYIWLLEEGGIGVSEEEILDKIANAMIALEAALAEPVQEPVATLYGTLPIYDTAQPQRKPQAEGKPWRCSCGANLYIDAEGNPRSKA